MTTRTTLWDQILSPIFRNFLLDEERLLELQRSIDWETECDRLQSPTLSYPDYYLNAAFHGIEKGYLTPSAAITYDPITQYVLPPNETWIRQGVIDRVQGQPSRILDLGCGTGSTTLLLKQAFPNAEVIGLDLSPYMLVMAERKARETNLAIDICHANAEHAPFLAEQFDLVTASLLFHETPPAVAQAILAEAFRLLRPGGEVIILDGNQETLRQTPWLMEIFEEPYLESYAYGSVAAWMGSVGFGQVQTQSHWWTNQLTWGIKPIVDRPFSTVETRFADGTQWMPS